MELFYLSRPAKMQEKRSGERNYRFRWTVPDCHPNEKKVTGIKPTWSL
jgi:hypothetical protein